MRELSLEPVKKWINRIRPPPQILFSHLMKLAQYCSYFLISLYVPILQSLDLQEYEKKKLGRLVRYWAGIGLYWFLRRTEGLDPDPEGSKINPGHGFRSVSVPSTLCSKRPWSNSLYWKTYSRRPSGFSYHVVPHIVDPSIPQSIPTRNVPRRPPNPPNYIDSWWTWWG